MSGGNADRTTEKKCLEIVKAMDPTETVRRLVFAAAIAAAARSANARDREEVLEGALASWKLGEGGRGSAHPLKAVGAIELGVPVGRCLGAELPGVRLPGGEAGPERERGKGGSALALDHDPALRRPAARAGREGPIAGRRESFSARPFRPQPKP